MHHDDFRKEKFVLKKLKDKHGFPKMISYEEDKVFNKSEIVMDPLGMSLYRILVDMKGRLSKPTIFGIIL